MRDMMNTFDRIEAKTHGKNVPLWGIYGRYTQNCSDREWYLCDTDERPELYREWHQAVAGLEARDKNPDVEYVITPVHAIKVTATEHEAALAL